MQFKISAQRWPWQDGYDWKGTKICAPLNANHARFGGGWKWSLGFSLSGIWPRGTFVLDLLYGSIRIHWNFKNEMKF